MPVLGVKLGDFMAPIERMSDVLEFEADALLVSFRTVLEIIESS